MNIPPEVARAQGHHGIKGAEHGKKGGRPPLQLTDDERKEHRRQQQEAYRRRKGILPREVLTLEERRERDALARAKYWDEEYRQVWGKLPGEALTAQQLSTRYPKFRAWVRSLRQRNHPLHCSVDFVRKHYRELRRKEREEWLAKLNEEDRQTRIQRRTRQPSHLHVVMPELEDMTHHPAPKVGRNEPCPCGSGRKFKKCCGR